MPGDIVAFVRARLDEDAEALVPVAGAWSAITEYVNLPRRDLSITLQHVARWSPERMLRAVDAKRRIVDEYVAAHTPDDDLGFEHGWKEGLGTAVEELATEWSDHADYRQEWKP